MAKDITPAPASEPADDSSELGFENAFTQAAGESPAAPSQPESTTLRQTTAPPPAPSSQAAPPAPAATAPAAGPPSTASTLLEQARAAGLSLDGISNDADLARELLNHVRQVQPYVQLGQRYLSEGPKAKGGPDEEDEDVPDTEVEEFDPEAYFGSKWSVPQADPQWQFLIQHGLVMRDENGMLVSKPGYEALAMPVLSQMNQAEAARAEQVRKLFEGNPFKNFHEVLIEPMRRAWQKDMQELVAQRFQTKQHEDAISQFERANAAWMYQADATGRQSPTAQGQKFFSAIQTLKDAGIADPMTLLQLGMQISGVNPAATAAPASPAAAAAPPAAPAPQSPQPTNPAAASAAKVQSFLDSAQERARHSPQASSYQQASPDAPVTVDDSELDNFFTRAHRQSAAAAR